jgi:Domain of unknown function (DUF4129)
MTRPLPAKTEHAGLRRRSALLALAAAILLLGPVAALPVPAHAADDSNAGQLTPAPTVSPEALSSAMNSLAQGSNDPQLQQLMSQFQSQLEGGNYSGSASTLVQLQGLSDQGGTSASLNALLQSLTVGSSGASINATTLSSLLNANSGASSGSQQRLSVDMQTLANLMKYANPTLASELLQNSSLLSQGAFAGSGGLPGGARAALPGVSPLPGLSMPSIGAPSLSVGSPSGGLPAVSPSELLVPLIVFAAVAALFLSRGRVAGLTRSRNLSGVPLLGRSKEKGEGDGGAVPTEPRKRIEFYFGRAVRLMARRGVPKLESETHREFSSKCEGRPERASVSTISSLYEKAKFSGRDVGTPEAYLAAASFLAMEKEGR